jgi:hypothetical protein
MIRLESSEISSKKMNVNEFTTYIDGVFLLQVSFVRITCIYVRVLVLEVTTIHRLICFLSQYFLFLFLDPKRYKNAQNRFSLLSWCFPLFLCFERTIKKGEEQEGRKKNSLIKCIPFSSSLLSYTMF